MQRQVTQLCSLIYRVSLVTLPAATRLCYVRYQFNGSAGVNLFNTFVEACMYAWSEGFIYFKRSCHDREQKGFSKIRFYLIYLKELDIFPGFTWRKSTLYRFESTLIKRRVVLIIMSLKIHFSRTTLLERGYIVLRNITQENLLEKCFYFLKNTFAF